MKLIDFHCDTPLLLARHGATLENSPGAVNTRSLSPFSSYLQIAAFFCPPDVKDADGMQHTAALARHLKTVATRADAAIVSTREGLTRAFSSRRVSFLPSVEDLRVIASDLTNVKALFSLGVRVATLTWKGENIIGGAWDTAAGLSPFGREALDELLRVGVIPDRSHASRKTFFEAAEICRKAKRPMIATHSNAYAVTPHGRNLDDEQLKTIASLGGVIGINLYPPFLTSDPVATVDDVVAHIRHVFRVAGSEAIVLGTDLDGIDETPKGLSDPSHFALLRSAMQKSGFSASEIRRLFFQNGYRFLIEHLPTESQM